MAESSVDLSNSTMSDADHVTDVIRNVAKTVIVYYSVPFIHKIENCLLIFLREKHKISNIDSDPHHNTQGCSPIRNEEI